MASDLRKRWQDFKKSHALFEKSKNFKSDVGPQLDKFDKARDEFAELQQKLAKKAAEVVTLGKSLAAAIKGYEAVVKDLEPLDKSINADFNKLNFEVFYDCYVKAYADWHTKLS